MPTQKKKPPLLPVYLIAGEDELKRATVMRRLRERLGTMGDLTFNSETFSGATCTGEEIVTAANTLPFASEVRLVEVHEIEKLKKADLDLVLGYLKEPCATTVLALEGTKVAKNSRLMKAVVTFGKTAYIDCAPFARKDLSSAVRAMAVGQGVTFTQGAAATLIDLVGTNTVALDAGIRKLALAHRGSDPVNENEVISLVSRTAEIKTWEFVDAFSARNVQRCLYVLHRMGQKSPYALLPMCVTRIRDLITVKAYVARGEARALPSVLKAPDWRVRKFQGWAKGFATSELIAALRCARDAEMAMKSGADPDEAFLTWLLGACVRQRS